MVHLTGPADTHHAIPRYRYSRGSDESARDFLERVALAARFAYAVDPNQVDDQPEFELDVETIVLPEGVLMRSQACGRLRQVRDRDRIQATGADQLFVYFIRAGRLDLLPSRTGRPASSGDIVVIDLAHPFELALDGYETTLAVIGRALLPPRLRDRQMHGTIVPRDHPLTGMTTTLVEQLFDISRRLSPDQATRILHHAVGLLGLALEDVTDPARIPVALKTATEAMIDERLDDPRLAPATIAGALGVSRATLYRAFDKRGGIRKLIAARRLERAWTLASSPAGPARPEIARLCGFRKPIELDAVLLEAFDADCAAIRSASDAARIALTARATELMKQSWHRRTHLD